MRLGSGSQNFPAVLRLGHWVSMDTDEVAGLDRVLLDWVQCLVVNLFCWNLVWTELVWRCMRIALGVSHTAYDTICTHSPTTRFARMLLQHDSYARTHAL